MTKTQPNVSLSAQDLSIFAFAISTMMTCEVGPHHTRENPLKMGFSVGDTFRAEVEFYNRGEDWAHASPIWDGTRVNGKETGNRSGARDEFARLLFAHYAGESA